MKDERNETRFNFSAMLPCKEYMKNMFEQTGVTIEFFKSKLVQEFYSQLNEQFDKLYGADSDEEPIDNSKQ